MITGEFPHKQQMIQYVILAPDKIKFNTNKGHDEVLYPYSMVFITQGFWHEVSKSWEKYLQDKTDVKHFLHYWKYKEKINKLQVQLDIEINRKAESASQLLPLQVGERVAVVDENFKFIANGQIKKYIKYLYEVQCDDNSVVSCHRTQLFLLPDNKSVIEFFEDWKKKKNEHTNL